MATIDTGNSNAKELNRDLPLIPFIDFLLCIISFLLITAVWSQLARIEANAQVPGTPSHVAPDDSSTRLHVRVREGRFDLEWRQGSTVVATSSVPREAVPIGSGDVAYPALARQLSAEWQANGRHRRAEDRQLDQAVLHTSNTVAFGDVVAIMDAIHSPQREIATGGARESVPAFSVSFAVD